MQGFVSTFLLLVIVFSAEYMAVDFLYLRQRIIYRDPAVDFCFEGHADATYILLTLYMGRGIIIYRLLRGWPTFVVKYIHSTFLMGVLFFTIAVAYVGTMSKMCFGYPFDHEYEDGMDDDITWIRHHSKFLRIVMFWCLLQVGAAAVVFFLLPQYARRQFTRFHATMGLFLYIFCYMTNLSVTFRVYHFSTVTTWAKADQSLLHVLGLLYMMSVIAILVTPQFESEIVGWI